MVPFGFSGVSVALFLLAQTGTHDLERRLLAEDPEALATDSRTHGDPARGARAFYRAQLACAKCHTADGPSNPLGPDLAKVGKEVTGAHLVESVLNPSKVIRPGYETVTLATAGGRTFTGLLAEDRPDAVVLRDPAQDGKLVAVAKAEIEARKDRGPSLMPAGLVNGLDSRQEFLDLVCFLREIADKGPARARELRPDLSTLAAPAPPAYENDIDHAGMIAGLGPGNLKNGEAIYQRVCANCHGTKTQPGSMPTSPRFASSAFKNGSGPFAMYRTLTQGFGQMPPQTWMVPVQKYDVIHYIRETFFKPDNPKNYVPVGPDYLSLLPKGTSRGPAPATIEPWSAMDYGPSLMATIEVGDGDTNYAYKGVAVRLDPGPGGVSRGRHWAVYDHDTMSLAGAWSGQGFIDWRGINFDGRHESHPRATGRVEVASPNGPGWADPATGNFDDPRPAARDGRRYGPLPHAHIRFRGLYHHADKVVLSYSVGVTPVLEMPGVETGATSPVFTRTLNLGARPNDLVMQVAHDPVAGGLIRVVSPKSELAIFGRDDASPVEPLLASVSPPVPNSEWLT
ncbi:MAG: c-type cytochrome, partial [Planctomycetia bacterium]|nr:c-type cytochrome [Planctomycetia bacterium]